MVRERRALALVKSNLSLKSEVLSQYQLSSPVWDKAPGLEESGKTARDRESLQMQVSIFPMHGFPPSMQILANLLL